jgi:hypothetical protein
MFVGSVVQIVVLVVAVTLAMVGFQAGGEQQFLPFLAGQAPQEVGAVVVTPAELLVAALFMATVANRLVEGLITPIFTKFAWDKFWLTYIAWAVGGVLVWLSGINLFEAYLPSPLAGQILSALVAGGGANLIHDLFAVQGK